MPTPAVLVKHIIIGAQGLGSDPRAGQIRHSVTNSSLLSFRGFLGVEVVLHDKVTVVEMGLATRYTFLRITASMIKI